jgi:peptidoglycan/LPS O-acetylase OafA/YrhL
MNFQTMSKQRKMILIAAAVGVICMFLPWISISFLGQSATVNGMHDSGILVFLCLLAAGAIAFMGDQTTNLNKTNWMLIIIVGGLAALIMLIKFLNSMDALDFIGIGFYGVLLASIGVVAFAFMNRSATDTLQGGFDSLKGEMNRRMNTPNTNSTTTTMPTTTTVSHTSTDDPTRPIV